jgi:hypothetical protein
MRVVVCGAEATGKTSLVEAVASAVRSVVLPDPRPEAVNRHGYVTLYEADRHVDGVWTGLLDAQLKREAMEGDVVIDTGLLDLWALFVRWGWNGATPETLDALLSATATAVAKYDRILLLPPLQVAGYAPHRFIHAANARHMDRILRHVIDELGVGDRMVLLERPGTEDLDVAVQAVR